MHIRKNIPDGSMAPGLTACSHNYLIDHGEAMKANKTDLVVEFFVYLTQTATFFLVAMFASVFF